MPAKIRNELGNEVILKKTPEGYLLVSWKQEIFLEEFRKLITSEPKRTGKPELWSPQEMKAIWK